LPSISEEVSSENLTVAVTAAAVAAEKELAKVRARRCSFVVAVVAVGR